MNPLIAPSILAADFANLQKEVEMINDSVADYIHVDIMDGVFVPNISFGLPVVEAINRHAKKPLDVHLMIVEPDKYLEAFHKAGAAQITVHYEACPHLHRTVQAIKAMGCKVGVAINPHTPIRALQDIVREVDTVLIMSVNPGFGGQEFIDNTYKKINALSELIVETGSHARIEIDGGVSLSNAKKLIENGANVLVAGNFVFSSENPIETINKLKSVI
ncbi:ribulose-phosphate 3-epimerase [uncultured Cyclobacterium sp.]|uniref:ribulose-phosphate 3-epimerase n=1 Tax=uncultured Cyclobacterium sp. TaxID=453820 RepID=UPI0030EC26B2